MSIVAANATQGAALLSGAQDFYSHDDAADNKAGGAYEHRATSFSATEAESWCDFFRAVRSTIAFPVCYNTSGANLPAGTAIYPAAANAAGIILGLANYSSAAAMPHAILQSSAANGAMATIAKTATVTGVDTSAAANGASVYLGTSGGWTANAPATPYRKYELGRVGLSAVSGTIFMDVRTPWKGNIDDLDDVNNSAKADGYALKYDAGTGKIIYGLTAVATHASTHLELGADPTNSQPMSGFLNRSDSNIAIAANGLFSITPASANFSFYCAGTKYTKTSAETVQVTANYAQTYIYYGANGTLLSGTGVWDITANAAPVAIVYKGSANYVLQEERHGYLRNRDWHKWAHEFVGCVYASGGTGTFANATFSIAQFEIHDEDIETDSGGALTTASAWKRHTGGTYMDFTPGTTTPYIANALGPLYDASGTQTIVPASDYYSTWFYGTPDKHFPVYTVQAQRTSGTLANALVDPLPTLPGFTTNEWKLLYQAVYRRNGSGADSIFQQANDYRASTRGPLSSTVSSGDHQALSNRGASGAHPATSISVDVSSFSKNLSAADTNVQLALNTIDALTVAAGNIAYSGSITYSDGTYHLQNDGANTPTANGVVYGVANLTRQYMTVSGTGGVTVTANSAGLLISSANAMSADIANGVCLKLYGTTAANGCFSGIESEGGTAGANIAFGDLCYYKAADSYWYKTNATSANTAGPVRVGFCISPVTTGSGANTIIMFKGKLRADPIFPSLTVSAPVYIGPSDGAVVVTANAASGSIVRIVGHAVDADTVHVAISPDWLELA